MRGGSMNYFRKRWLCVTFNESRLDGSGGSGGLCREICFESLACSNCSPLKVQHNEAKWLHIRQLSSSTNTNYGLSNVHYLYSKHALDTKFTYPFQLTLVINDNAINTVSFNKWINKNWPCSEALSPRPEKQFAV